MRDRMILLGTWALATLVAVSLAVVAAQMTWHLTGETGELISADIAPGQHRPATPPADLTPILSLQPFGVISMPSEPQPEAQETDLELVLHGVVLAQPADASIALIAVSGQDVRAYGVDDPIPGGALLKKILPDKVILFVNGRQETLSFPQEIAPSGVARLRSLVSNSEAERPAESVDNTAPAVIERYRQRIAANPKTVLDNLGVSVAEQGYQIGQQPAAGVRRAGLRPGDIVARVNGEDVGNIESDRRLFDKVAASGRARVEVIRDGKRIIMSFPLR